MQTAVCADVRFLYDLPHTSQWQTFRSHHGPSWEHGMVTICLKARLFPLDSLTTFAFHKPRGMESNIGTQLHQFSLICNIT